MTPLDFAELTALYLLMYGLLVRAGHGVFAALAMTNHLIGGAVVYATRRWPA